MAANDLNQQMYVDPELSGLARQRQMAQLLVQQGLQQPQGDMVGNRYVPVNPMERIGNLASALIGQRGNEVLDVKQNQISEMLRQRGAQDVQDIFSAMQTGGTQGAMAEALKRNSPQAQRLQTQLEKQMFEPKWEKMELPDENGNIRIGVANFAAQNPISTFIPGGVKPDVEQAKGKWEGYLPQSGGFGPASAAGNSSFAPAMAKVFGFEGDAYVAKDGLSGAPSKFGINQKFNPDIDVKNLTKPQAEAIYKTRYWDAIGGDTLPPKTAEIAFDAAVNQGPNYAKELIAKTGGDPTKMLQQRAQDYNQLVQSNPAQAQYLPSWMNRLSTLAKDVSPQQGGAQTGENKYMPANLPQYQYDPSLTPKENAQAAAAFSKENQSAIKNAKNSFSTLKTAADILNSNAPSSGRAENIITGTREFFGGGGEASKADAKLGILGTKLTMQVPRFEGPQSDKDTALYTAAAGDVGNPNKPIATRLSAVQQMIELNKKYYPGGEWDKIDVSGPVVKKQTFLKGEQKFDPIQFREGLSVTDKDAFDWARKNPTDPRSVQIKKTLGIE